MVVRCYLANDNGNKYAIFNAMMEVEGKFSLSCLNDFLNYHADPDCDTLDEIDIPNDGNNYQYEIEAELQEFGTGVGMDSNIAYEIVGYTRL